MRWLSFVPAVALVLAVGSAVAEDDDPARRYTVRAQAPELEVASQDEVVLEVEANNEYAIDPKYPAKLWFIPEVGDEVLVARKQIFDKKDADYSKDGKKMSWTVEVTAKKAGDHPVDVKMEFQVCDAEGDCHVGRHKMRLKLIVKD